MTEAKEIEVPAEIQHELNKAKAGGWCWYLARIPEFGGNCMIELQGIDLTKELPERFTFRRPTQLVIDPKSKALHFLPWMPYIFDALEADAVGLIERKLVGCLIPASLAAQIEGVRVWFDNERGPKIVEASAALARKGGLEI